MEKLNTAEDLVYFISTNHLALSRYDSKFIGNIQKLNQLTSNQVILFHKLLFKYSRQLAKHELFPENLIVLPWRKPIVESVPEFTVNVGLGFVLTVIGVRIADTHPIDEALINTIPSPDLTPFEVVGAANVP